MMNVDGSILFEDEFEQQPSIAVNGVFSVKNAQSELEYFLADKKPKQINDEKEVCILSEQYPFVASFCSPIEM